MSTGILRSRALRFLTANRSRGAAILSIEEAWILPRASVYRSRSAPGLISFLSPCVLPLVPGYISAVAGVAPADIRARRVIGPSLAFVASFSVIFIALGLLGQQALHGALTGPAALKICGAVIIAMGVLFVLAPFVPRLSREWHMGALMERAGRGGPGAHRRRVRAGLDAVHRSDAGGDRHRRRRPRARPPTGRSCSRSTAPGWASRS